jgi:3D (Asp-Asp-Asp) domain-containing protein
MRNCSQKVSMFIAALCVASIATAGGKRENKELVEVKSTPIKTTIRYEFSRSVRPGQLVKAQEGHDGVSKKTFKVSYEDGHRVKSELVGEETVAPVPTLYLINRSGFSTSRGSFTRSKVMVMKASAYDPSPATIGPHATGRTCTGRKADYGVAAVDPRVIPLGTLLYVEGYGLALAADRGGAIKGNRIDLCYASKKVADGYGYQMVKVHILNTR